MEKILTLLGFKVTKHHEKYRTSFVKDHVKFEIDEHPGIPPYLEIEGSPKDITASVKALGYRMQDTCNLTASQVLKKYGRPENTITFKQK